MILHTAQIASISVQSSPPAASAVVAFVRGVVRFELSTGLSSKGFAGYFQAVDIRRVLSHDLVEGKTSN